MKKVVLLLALSILTLDTIGCDERNKSKNEDVEGKFLFSFYNREDVPLAPEILSPFCTLYFTGDRNVKHYCRVQQVLIKGDYVAVKTPIYLFVEPIGFDQQQELVPPRFENIYKEEEYGSGPLYLEFARWIGDSKVILEDRHKKKWLLVSGRPSICAENYKGNLIGPGWFKCFVDMQDDMHLTFNYYDEKNREQMIWEYQLKSD